MSNRAIEAYGWTAVPRNLETLLSECEASGSPVPIEASSIRTPDTRLANEVLEYAKKELRVETFNHSMRVYLYGRAILAHAFPSWQTPAFDETYFLTSLLHDIGTTTKNLHSTLLSFEFHGALISHSLLLSLSAPTALTENVVETIIRHQDLGATGKLTRIGALVQLATLLDNVGGNSELVSKGTVESVLGLWPRMGWSGCFAETVREEVRLKPWCHSTHIEGFAEGVEGNEFMAPYDAGGL